MANNKIIIGDTPVGENNPLFLVAEIGINHNGSLDIAKKLIDAAFACNWHCVKFQKRTPDLCVPEHQKKVVRDTPWGEMTYLDYRIKVEFETQEYSYINKYCKEKPILWSASVWDKPSIEFLLGFNVPFIKIPSAKITEREIVISSAKSGKPVFLSTGMSTIEEIDSAVNLLEKHSNGNYVIMHTNSLYPTPIEELNLNIILFLKDRYDCIVGYSGHEYDLEPSVIAAVLGAKVIERHITMDHKMWGSDHFASLEVHAMNMLHKRLKDVDVILGDGIKRITKGENEMRKKLRGY
jgi:N-acetylneuraminate synthase